MILKSIDQIARRRGMSPEQQRIKIAEACGWQIQHDGPGGGYCGLHPKKHSPDDSPCPLPDYLNDLNAMHAAEDYIPDRYDRYEYFLKRRLGDEWGYATAAQRAEAFLRTLGLWEDAE